MTARPASCSGRRSRAAVFVARAARGRHRSLGPATRVALGVLVGAALFAVLARRRVSPRRADHELPRGRLASRAARCSSPDPPTRRRVWRGLLLGRLLSARARRSARWSSSRCSPRPTSRASAARAVDAPRDGSGVRRRLPPYRALDARDRGACRLQRRDRRLALPGASETLSSSANRRATDRLPSIGRATLAPTPPRAHLSRGAVVACSTGQPLASATPSRSTTSTSSCGRGEVLGLLGPNGAGKTTAVAILLGLRRPGLAAARFCSGATRESPHARRPVGVVLQDVGFPETLRVARSSTSCGRTIRSRRRRAALLERFGLGPLTDRRPAVSRAASGDASRSRSLSSADRRHSSSTSRLLGSTPPRGGTCWRELRDSSHDGGAVLLTTHQLDEAERFATRLVLLVRGKSRARRDGRRRCARGRGSPASRCGPTAAAAARRGESSPSSTATSSTRATPMPSSPRSPEPAYLFAELEVAALSLEEAFLAVTEQSR